MVSVPFVAMSSGPWCALCNVVFWAGKYDVMYKIWSRHSSLLKYIYILYIHMGVGTENILRKV